MYFILFIILISFFILGFGFRFLRFDNHSDIKTQTTILNNQLYYYSNQFTTLKLLENNFDVFAAEIPDIDKTNVRSYPYSWVDQKKEEKNNLLFKIVNEDTDKRWFKGWYQDSEWFHFPLIYDGNPTKLANLMCPNSLNILRQLKYPTIRVGGFAALFPYSQLPLHKDDTFHENSLTLNMGVKNCEKSSLYLKHDNNFIKIKHELGKVVLYNSNETYHYADNLSEEIRYILFLEITL